MFERISQLEVRELLEGKTISLSTGLESSEEDPVNIECYIIPNEYLRKWVLVTALAGQDAIGFVDGQYYGEYKTSKIESPHILRVRDQKFPHEGIRFEAREDGLFVVESQRGQGVGRELMLTIREIFIGLGAKIMYVSQPKESSKSFYTKLGMEEILGAFREVFEHTDEE